MAFEEKDVFLNRRYKKKLQQKIGFNLDQSLLCYIKVNYKTNYWKVFQVSQGKLRHFSCPLPPYLRTLIFRSPNKKKIVQPWFSTPAVGNYIILPQNNLILQVKTKDGTVGNSCNSICWVFVPDMCAHNARQIPLHPLQPRQAPLLCDSVTHADHLDCIWCSKYALMS